MRQRFGYGIEESPLWGGVTSVRGLSRNPVATDLYLRNNLENVVRAGSAAEKPHLYYMRSTLTELLQLFQRLMNGKCVLLDLRCGFPRSASVTRT